MKKHLLFLIAIIFFLGSCSDNKEINPDEKKITKLNIRINFNEKSSAIKDELAMTEETPLKYKIAIKSARLIGGAGYDDVLLFNQTSLQSSKIFAFTDNTIQTLFEGNIIPQGNYTAIRLEIYYLEMRIKMATTNRGVEERNVRVYLSDDMDYEQGSHHSGDMVQFGDDGSEHGWLLGEGQVPDMDPIKPRTSAYKHPSGGWYNFDGKSGEFYGPYGDEDFMDAPHPIYYEIADFNFSTLNGGEILIDLNINNCWKFQDYSGDGIYGAADILDPETDPRAPTKWHMDLPDVTITIE